MKTLSMDLALYVSIILSLYVTGCFCLFEDEMQVYDAGCIGEDKFPCLSKGCVPMSQRCDGTIDCEDGSDENFCTHLKRDLELCNETHEYICADSKLCIPFEWICNGEEDCLDASDEFNCTTVSPELPAGTANATCTAFQCGDGKCISQLWVCDGQYDCKDKSDENNPDICRHSLVDYKIRDGSLCDEHTSMIKPYHRFYKCLDSSYCLPDTMMCNGITDCRDNSDEDSLYCANWQTMCKDHKCEGDKTSCTPNRHGPTCICEDANHKKYNEQTHRCEDVDECLNDIPHCSHFCTNMHGHYSCSCDYGYTEDNFGYLCFADGPEAKLFFSTYTEIKFIKLKTKEIVTVATDLKEAYGIAFDGIYLYWVETAHGHQSIFKAQFDDVNDTKQVLVAQGLENPGDVAVDWLGGNVYFSDWLSGFIAACRVDGSICTKILTGIGRPGYVTLNAKNGTMYWVQNDPKPKIMMARMDGSQQETLVDKFTNYPKSLSIDTPNGRLYFIDYIIKVVVIASKRVYELADKLFHHPFGISVFENTVYWSDIYSNTIRTTDKMHGTGVKRHVLLSSNAPIMDIQVYHPALMNNTENPCRGNNCSHLCFVTSNRTHVCACPDHMTMKDNVCLYPEGYRAKYLVVASGQLFTKIQYDTLGNPEIHTTHFDIGRVQAMAYDTYRDSLYIYDGQRKTINCMNMTDFSLGVTYLLLADSLVNVVDMDYDYATDSLYILDEGRQLIEVLSIHTMRRAHVYKFQDDEQPISLCVIPDLGRMLVAVLENERHGIIHIDSIGLDGQGREHLILHNLKGPRIRLRYVPKLNQVYISDESNGAIDVMKPDGSSREVFQLIPSTIASLAVTDNLVFWTDTRTRRLFWSNIHEYTQYARRIELAIFPNNKQLLLQSTSSYPDPSSILLKHPCLIQRPCSDICVQVSHPKPYVDLRSVMEYKCLCPAGMALEDGKCVRMTICTDDQIHCHKSNSCYPKYGKCDGVVDCPKAEDEEDCSETKPVRKCSVNEVYCDGFCMEKGSICRGWRNESECSTTEFQCNSTSLCISRSLICDGRVDCPDGSDELKAECDKFDCLDTEFVCTSGHCILKTWVCDGDEDCKDGSDELACVHSTCAPGLFRCNSNACIEMRKRCDGHHDCLDHSDEVDCEEPVTVQIEEEKVRCEDWEEPCELAKNICIPVTARCNMKIDCPGGTDENGCSHSCTKPNKFECKQQRICISISKVCNAIVDCNDGSDETPEACDRVNRTSHLFPPRHLHNQCIGGYRCDDGECLELEQVCNGIPDCLDNSDEYGLCLTACVNNNCSYACQPSPRRAMCKCRVGYVLNSDQVTCSDKDECTEDVCSQGCHNTPGSFICTCHPGYALRSDRRSCKAVIGNMSILYVSNDTVRSISANGTDAVEFQDPSVANISDIDYNVRQNKLYVASSEYSKLIEVNALKNVTVIMNVGRPSKVAVDWITDNVYFADSSLLAQKIRVCNFKKKKCAVLKSLPSYAELKALVVDPGAGKMFYCVTHDYESVVWSASLSGRHSLDLTTVRNCTGLTVDSFKQRLYVAETQPSHITRMTYYGEEQKKILMDHPQLEAPHGLAIFEDYIYYVPANTYRLSRCQLFGSKHCESYVYRVFDANTFVIRHESAQRYDIKNECEDYLCPNVCTLDDDTPKCICDDGNIALNGKCRILIKEMLAIFNGATEDEFVQSHRVASTVIIIVVMLLVVFLGIYFYYRRYKRNRARESTYTEVRYQSRPREDTTETGPTVELTVQEGRAREFVNPLRYMRNIWEARSFGRHARPQFSPPPLSPDESLEQQRTNMSDTESDLYERETEVFG